MKKNIDVLKFLKNFNGFELFKLKKDIKSILTKKNSKEVTLKSFLINQKFYIKMALKKYLAQNHALSVKRMQKKHSGIHQHLLFLGSVQMDTIISLKLIHNVRKI